MEILTAIFFSAKSPIMSFLSLVVRGVDIEEEVEGNYI